MATNKRLIKSNDDAAPVVPTSFNTVLWDGTGSSQSITGVGFDPEFIITRNRDLAVGANVFDVIRDNYTLYTYFNGAEDNFSSSFDISSANTDGFDLIGESSSFNSSGKRYVAWCWKAAGYANTFNVLENGSTTSSATAAGAGITAGLNTTNYSVSSNRDAGFSIVRFDAGSTAWNVGHGLDVAPSVIISKMYTFGNAWEVYHKDLGTGKYLQLSTTGGTYTDAGAFSSVTDTTWTSYTTLTSGSYIAYCFAEVAGFSKFGSYTGNGSNQYINLGFEPAFIMVKRTDNTGTWGMFDNKRGLAAPQPRLLANDSASENTGTTYWASTDSTGFTVQGSSIYGSGNFIYMAFADQF